MTFSRRGFMGALAGLLATPAIVRADSLMKLSGVPLKCVGALVDASNQTGCSITITPALVGFEVGDIVTIAGVEAVSRIDGSPTGNLRDFVVTARVEAGERVLHLYPPIIPISDETYRTVAALPRNRAPIHRTSRADAKDWSVNWEKDNCFRNVIRFPMSYPSIEYDNALRLVTLSA